MLNVVEERGKAMSQGTSLQCWQETLLMVSWSIVKAEAGDSASMGKLRHKGRRCFA